MIYSTLLAAALLVTGTEARSLWSPKPATYGAPTSDEFIIKTTYPLGNGRLGGELQDEQGVGLVLTEQLCHLVARVTKS